MPCFRFLLQKYWRESDARRHGQASTDNTNV
jgi:hypothetical protein